MENSHIYQGVDILGKRKFVFILFLLAISLALSSCGIDTTKNHPTLLTEDYNGLKIDSLNKYTIEVELNTEEKTYSGKQWINYVNNTGVELSEIFIHLYPNAFKTKATAPFFAESIKMTYPDGFKPGFIDIENLKVDKRKVDYDIGGEGDTVLHIELKSPLKPGEKTEIYLEYEVQLPPAQDRFGYGENTFNLGNWYPIVCVYDEDGWNTDPYYILGDPFYSDTSNYKVRIIAPKDIIIASSGNILKEKVKADKKIWDIEGKLIRDFAWVASDKFKVLEGEVEGTQIKAYFLEDYPSTNEFAYNTIENSIKTFNRIFGKYPYGQYSVVATNFSGGMEYPGIVFIGKQFYNNYSRNDLENVIVHETAHQWWYGVVGNDEIDEAWLDESLATYSETVYISEIYGEEMAENFYEQTVEDAYTYGKELYDFDEVMLKPLSKFQSWADYGSLVYSKGAMFLNEIKDDFGKEILYDILNKYYHEYRFLNAKSADFIRVCEEVTNTSFEDKAKEWFYGNK